MKRMISIALAIVLAGATTISGQERTGTSQADLPSYNSAFSIENTTGVTIPYMVRWGNNSQWKRVFLQSGHTETHSFPLGQNRDGRAPTPYVRIDAHGGDGRHVTPKEYRMEFLLIEYAGHGPAVNKAGPKRYFFQYGGVDGKSLDLRAR
jgi:hypothetical protein